MIYLRYHEIYKPREHFALQKRINCPCPVSATTGKRFLPVCDSKTFFSYTVFQRLCNQEVQGIVIIFVKPSFGVLQGNDKYTIFGFIPESLQGRKVFSVFYKKRVIFFSLPPCAVRKRKKTCWFVYFLLWTKVTPTNFSTILQAPRSESQDERQIKLAKSVRRKVYARLVNFCSRLISPVSESQILAPTICPSVCEDVLTLSFYAKTFRLRLKICAMNMENFF